jgi:WhiB family redox-sensing transcriptional regulator
VVGGTLWVMLEHRMLFGLPPSRNWDDDPGEIPEDPEWMDEGACRNMDTNIFFDLKGNVNQAKAICATCPVRLICLEYALKNCLKGGVWGGESSRSRLRMLALRRKNG